MITLGLVDPFLRITGASERSGENQQQSNRPAAINRLPVLMYHRIADDPESGISPYYRVCTSPQRFAEQMQWLAGSGYRGVSLTEGLAALGNAVGQESLESAGDHGVGRAAAGTTEASKLVAITFDDGFRDFHTAAFPTLARHGFTATMYLPTAYIGEKRLSFKSHECLTWPEVRELQRAGIEFGSHTVNHPILVRLNWSEIERELHDSRQMIEQHLGADVSSFAYPYAFPSADRDFTVRLREIIMAAGYTTCATTEIGTVTAAYDPLQVRRLPANGCDDYPLLRAKISGAYDWLHSAQTLFKKLKASPVHPAA